MRIVDSADIVGLYIPELSTPWQLTTGRFRPTRDANRACYGYELSIDLELGRIVLEFTQPNSLTGRRSLLVIQGLKEIKALVEGKKEISIVGMSEQDNEGLTIKARQIISQTRYYIKHLYGDEE